MRGIEWGEWTKGEGGERSAIVPLLMRRSIAVAPEPPRLPVGRHGRVPPEVLAVARQVFYIVRRVTGSPAYRVFLFGSWAAGRARERSDIDIGIEGPAPLIPAAMLEIRDACEALPTLYTVEVVDFTQVSSLFREEATARIYELESA